MIPAALATDVAYPLDSALRAALQEAQAEGDTAREQVARLALRIREHKHFRALVLRMYGVTFAETGRRLARTEKASLIGQPEPGTDLARAHALARLIVDDLDVPDADQGSAVALALVLAEECRLPSCGKRSAHRVPA